jgi:hypothetical protein
MFFYLKKSIYTFIYQDEAVGLTLTKLGGMTIELFPSKNVSPGLLCIQDVCRFLKILCFIFWKSNNSLIVMIYDIFQVLCVIGYFSCELWGMYNKVISVTKIIFIWSSFPWIRLEWFIRNHNQNDIWLWQSYL